MYCPKYSDIRLAPCPVRPAKELVVHEVVKTSFLHNLYLGDFSKQQPNKDWLLNVLSTLNPKHYFFAKSYMPPPRPKKRVAKRLGNEDGFFSDLPNRHRFTKVSRRTINMLIKKQENEPYVFNLNN